jgi:hypothetical protein
MVARWLDRVLIPLLLLASFVALVYAPMFYLGCGWEGLALGREGPCGQDWVGRAWLGYLQVEPFYAQAPLWLQLVNELDSYLFGWFYLLSAFVFLTRRERRGWYRGLATFMAGMMSYAMTLYFSWQILGHHETGAQLGKVLGYNGLWLLIILLLLARLYVFQRPAAEAR